MLVKYPGLTIVGSLAMAFAIWVGAVTFEMVGLIVHPTLPLPGGDRVVQIHSWDASRSETESRTLHDFAIWRGTLKSVTDTAGNVGGPGSGTPEPETTTH